MQEELGRKDVEQPSFSSKNPTLNEQKMLGLNDCGIFMTERERELKIFKKDNLYFNKFQFSSFCSIM